MFQTSTKSQPLFVKVEAVFMAAVDCPEVLSIVLGSPPASSPIIFRPGAKFTSQKQFSIVII